MENKLGMVGMGKVTNGVITFVDASGKGFSKSVSRPVIKETIKEEVIVTTKEEVLDVPSFMKNRIKPEPMGQLIVVNFKKGEEIEVEEEEKEMIDVGEAAVELIDAVTNAAKRAIKRNPVFKYFFGEEE